MPYRKKTSIFSKIKSNWRDISWWQISIEALYFRRIIGNRGTDVMPEDWDNLIILDACRYDVFREVSRLPGILERRISRGGCTEEFLRNNFEGRRYLDTVYVTGNPMVDRLVGDCFYRIVPVWKDGWNDEYGTVLPETMVRYSLEADEKYPDKRLIIHFLQPHHPFLGENAWREIGDEASREIVGFNATVREKVMSDDLSYRKPQERVWHMLRHKVDMQKVWDAYKENLQIALPHVKELVDRLRGRTVISADHGNLFGERIAPLFFREYGHPGGIYAKNLVMVPWLVIESAHRKVLKEESDIAQTGVKYRQVDIEKERVKGSIRRLRESGRL